MPPSAAVTEPPPAQGPAATVTPQRKPAESSDSLFERVAWLYTFCREYLFRDDTKRIISSVWPHQTPPDGAHVIELGCGPGFYSRNLAQRFPQIHVTGVDQSPAQVSSAQERANARNVKNCSFERVNALALPFE